MYHRSQPESIQSMFATIAEHYDRANAVLSFGLHRRWNEAFVRAIGAKASLLDLCAGTGDIGLTFLKKNPESAALLLDFCPEMLEIARKKGLRFAERFETIVADAQAIPLQDECVEAITMAYGIRNVKNPLLAFQECFRVLKPSGVYGILELTRPSNPFIHLGHHLYLNTLLPLLGKWTAKNKEAYAYLSKSIRNFSAPSEIQKELIKIGFQKVRKIPLMGGTATILLAYK